MAIIAADIMTKDVLMVNPATSVREVTALLAEKHFGSIPVVDAAGYVLGVVSEEDMLLRAAKIHLPHHLTFLGSIIFIEDPKHFTDEAEKILALTAEKIMDTNYISTSPDTPVDLLAEKMLAEDIRRFLVIDVQQHLLGIITRADIVRMMFLKEQ